ncbi:HPr kinase/phosphorylase [Limoniibacter endophyticus]|uniref:HPr kinase/phosphorylase n=1 Tax=Limoniibacter endophyticus TaxID=1565040 RepID=UPI001AEEF4F4
MISVPCENIHATLIVLDDKGVLLRGPSGSGKSTLAYALIDAYVGQNRLARLVADDRVLAERHGERLIGTCPPSICGLMEVSGAGITRWPVLGACVIDFCFDLVDPALVERLPTPRWTAVCGLERPLFYLPERSMMTARNIVRGCISASLIADA